MANTVYMSKTGLIGGEATKLDSIDGAGLVDGDAAFVNVANVQYIYRLDADSAAVESSPNIIAPDTNAGDKRWILQGLNGASLNMPGLTASLPVFTDGSKNLVSNTMTGTGSVVMSNSPTLVTPVLGAASGTSLTLSGLTASLPVFTDGSKKLASKSVADTLTALGVGSAAFSAYVTSTQSNVTGDNTDYSITGAFWTELFDTGSCFSNGTFTAPVTGIYLLMGQVSFYGIASGHTFCLCDLTGTFGGATIWKGNPYACGAIGELCINGSVICSMNAGNTAYLSLQINNAAKAIVIDGGTVYSTLFCGYRLK